jgi:hypothetical protein
MRETTLRLIAVIGFRTGTKFGNFEPLVNQICDFTWFNVALFSGFTTSIVDNKSLMHDDKWLGYSTTPALIFALSAGKEQSSNGTLPHVNTYNITP